MVNQGAQVTVLMAVRDTPAAMLRQAVESIRQQTFRNFEFLILDDGSQDAATINELAAQAAQDSRIRLEKQSNRGLTATLNRGLTLVNAPLVARQDADDWSDPERLQLQVAFLQTHGDVALCGTNAWMHRRDARPLWRSWFPESVDEVRNALPERNPFFHGSVMFRTQAARDAGGYREEFPCAQDYDFFWRLAEAGGAANLPQPLYHYRYSGGAVSGHRAGEQARAHRAAQILAVARRELRREDIPQALARADEELESSNGPLRAALKPADHRMLAGDSWGALAAFCGVLRGHPASLLVWGKLLRWALYCALPPLRRVCFR